MIKIWLGIGALVLLTAATAGFVFWRGAMAGEVQQAVVTAEGSFYDLKTQTLLGEAADLGDYRGRVSLVVNVASKCGLTPQYTGLQALYEEFGEQGFVILAFPSNDFLNQEPGAPEEIRAFCSANYGVTFPLFAKMHVKGEQKSEVYRFLTRELDEPSWNFTKYLVGVDGAVQYRFSPKTAPDDAELRRLIAEELQRVGR